MTPDDLTPWQDTELVRALTADGTDTELAGEDTALAAFRASAPGWRRRGMVRFIGTSATTVVLVGAVGGGVAAAAYTRSLPEPVQTVFHEVLGPIGVPAPHNHPKGRREAAAAAAAAKPHASTTTSTPIPTRSSTPSLAPSPTTHHSPGATNLVGVAPAGSASPTPSPSPSLSAEQSATPTPSLTPSPSPTGPVGDPSTWSLSAGASADVVRVHEAVRVDGTLLDAAGQPVADHRVVIRVHIAGTSGWQRAAVRRTDADGYVQGRLDDLVHNTVVVLGAGDGVHSSPLRIVVRPILSASSTPAADGASYVVTVTADGGDPGDVVELLKHSANGWVRVGESQLDNSGSASFSVPAPRRQRGYLLRLPPTKLHGEAGTRIVLQPLS